MIASPRDIVIASHWRRAATALFLVMLPVLLVAYCGRALPALAGVALKPGDLVIGTLHTVSALDPAAGGIFVISEHPSFEIPQLVATGPNGEVYAADNYFGSPDQRAIVRIDLATGTPTVVASGGFGFFGGLTTEPDGNLLVADYNGSQIVRVDPATGARTMVSLGGKLHRPRDVAIEADGSILTTAAITTSTDLNAPRQILRIRAGTSAQEVVSTGGLLVTPAFLAVASDGTILVTDTGGNTVPDRIVRVHPQTGAQSPLSEFSSGILQGIAVNGAGTIYVAHMPTGIFRVDPATGQQQLVAWADGADLPGGIALVKAASGVTCSPRPPITVQTSKLGGGRLQVTIHAAGNGNSIRSIRAGASPNAVVEASPNIAGPDATFVVRRTAAGPVTQPFTVTDGCGDWPSFVGGGSGAF